MSIYTTPLQFGYFFSLVLWIVLLVRGIRENRLSDKLLGWVMFILAVELQDYTFGFAGINVLWNEMNGFPRAVHLLIGPTVYFYFRSQINRNFKLKKSHLIHLVPYLLYFLYEIIFFIQGPDVVQSKNSSNWGDYMGYFYMLVCYGSYGFYFFHCLKIYKAYRIWSVNQFSDLELIDFKWFRNFIICMIFYLISKAVMNIIDAQFDLPFYQDWWWNLALVGVSIYIGLRGISQKQPNQIFFLMEQDGSMSNSDTKLDSSNTDHDIVAKKLKEVMDSERLYLQTELNLSELAKHLNTNTSVLSRSINQSFKMNFNDYINSLRVDEFLRRYDADKDNNFTIVSLAFDAGFNSAATFNRAFKKLKGAAPKEYIKQIAVS